MILKKFRFAPKEDADPFLFEEKFKSASNEDADPFLFEKKFKSASNEDANPFLFEEKFRSASNEDANLPLFEEKFRFASVRGPFLVAQSCVVRWSDDLTRPRFNSGSCVRNSTLGHMVQWLPAYF